MFPICFPLSRSSVPEKAPEPAVSPTDIHELATKIQRMLAEADTEAKECLSLVTNSTPSLSKREDSGVVLQDPHLSPTPPNLALCNWPSTHPLSSSPPSPPLPPSLSLSSSESTVSVLTNTILQYKFDFFLSYLSDYDNDHKLASELFFRLKIALMGQTAEDAEIFLGDPAFRTVSRVHSEDFGCAELKLSKVVILLISEKAIRNICEEKEEDEYLRRQWEICLFGQEFKKCIVLPVFIGEVFKAAASCQSPRCKKLLTSLFQLQGFQLIEKMPIKIVVERALSQLSLFNDIERSRRSRREEFELVFRNSEFLWEAPDFTSRRSLSAIEFSCLFKSLEYNSHWRTVSINNHDGFEFKPISSLLASSLRLNTHLLHLDLSSNFLSDQTVEDLSKALAHMLPLVSSLVDLNLSKNQIGKRGVLSLFKALKDIPIKKLNLSQNSLTETCSSVVSEGLLSSSLVFLDISRNAGVVVDCHAIQKSPLEDLRVGHTDCLNGDKYLQVTSLKILRVESCNVTQVGLSSLADNSVLSELDLSQNDLLQSKRVMNVFRNSLQIGVKNLSILRLSDISLNNVVLQLVDGVKNHKSLQELVMKRCSLSGVAIETIVGSLSPSSKLCTLDVSQNSFGLQGALALLGSSSHGLKNISIAHCGIEDANDELLLLNMVSQIVSLDSLDVFGNFTVHQHKYDMLVAKSNIIDFSQW
ncbi:hypothetical protein BDR26DRAFT_1007402 [Obelidium mucronatum]|nr:hypothetical protein BDR26DRAFT_1007402 [Obelidium mucronatum]